MSRSVRRRRCERSAEAGSVVLGAAVMAFGALMALAVATVAAGVAARVAAANAADAAALAAAPVTFRPFGAQGTPSREAAMFAARNGARLIACTCPVDPSWRPRTVSVVVERGLRIPGLGSVRVTATSRATFDPTRLIPPVETDPLRGTGARGP